MSGTDRPSDRAVGRHRLHPALGVIAIVTIGSVTLIGTLELEIGPVILIFDDGHGIHLGDLVLASGLVPVALFIGWQLALGPERPEKRIKGSKR